MAEYNVGIRIIKKDRDESAPWHEVKTINQLCKLCNSMDEAGRERLKSDLCDFLDIVYNTNLLVESVAEEKGINMEGSLTEIDSFVWSND